MFTATSWVSFLLPPTSYPARTSLLVTVFLCQIGIFNTGDDYIMLMIVMLMVLIIMTIIIVIAPKASAEGLVF